MGFNLTHPVVRKVKDIIKNKLADKVKEFDDTKAKIKAEADAKEEAALNQVVDSFFG